MPRSASTVIRKLVRFAKGHRSSDRVFPPDQTGSGCRPQAIPPIVYQTAESRGVHPLHAKSLKEFRTWNHELSFVLFDGEARDAYMQEQWSNHRIYDVYRRAVFGQMRADIFRYCIVFERGGYYFDYNKGCSVPLTSLHEPDAEGLITAESNCVTLFPHADAATHLTHTFNLYAQWGFGFRPEHPLLETAINRIIEIEPHFRDVIFPVPKDGVLTMTATGLFTDAVRTYVSEHGAQRLTEAGVDFHGHGLFRLRGSKIALRSESHYAKQRNQAVVSAPKKGE